MLDRILTITIINMIIGIESDRITIILNSLIELIKLECFVASVL